MPIHFGTDGWRAVISDTFTFHNLRLVSQAIADAVNSDSWLNGTRLSSTIDPQKMVVGFDTRFLSDRYANDVARVLAANGYCEGNVENCRWAQQNNQVCRGHYSWWVTFHKFD